MTEIIFDEVEDWENRILCSDESCIGTVGATGICKECGKPYEGAPQAVPAAGDIFSRDTSGDVVADEEWENRVLCSDGCCIGVIGPDGKCKECGKPLK